MSTAGRFGPLSLKLSGTLPHTRLSYFRAGRNQIDLTNCLNMGSLQATLFIIMYLQSSGRLSACHSYIAVANASALQMGIHRSAASRGLDPVEHETRKRVFWALQTMDTCVTTILGLAKTLSDDQFDQELPLEVGDYAIRRNGI